MFGFVHFQMFIWFHVCRHALLCLVILNLPETAHVHAKLSCWTSTRVIAETKWKEYTAEIYCIFTFYRFITYSSYSCLLKGIVISIEHEYFYILACVFPVHHILCTSFHFHFLLQLLALNYISYSVPSCQPTHFIVCTKVKPNKELVLGVWMYHCDLWH